MTKGQCEFCGARSVVIHVVMSSARRWMCPSCEKETRKYVPVTKVVDSSVMSDFASKLSLALRKE